MTNEKQEFMRVLAQSIDREKQAAMLECISEDLEEIQNRIRRGTVACIDVAVLLDHLTWAIRVTCDEVGEWDTAAIERAAQE